MKLPYQHQASVGVEELSFRLRAQTDCGQPESRTTSGLVAYLDGEPVAFMITLPDINELIRDLKRNPWKFFWKE